MSEHDDFVANLLRAPWRLYKTVQVPGADGAPVTLEIRCPPQSVTEGLLREAKDLKEKGKDESAEALTWTRKVVALALWRPGGMRGCLTPEQVAEWPYASVVLPDCMAAINPAAGLEAAKKN